MLHNLQWFIQWVLKISNEFNVHSVINHYRYVPSNLYLKQSHERSQNDVLKSAFLCSHKMMHLHFYFNSCFNAEQNCVSRNACLKFCSFLTKLYSMYSFTTWDYCFGFRHFFVLDFQNTNVFYIELRKTFLIKKDVFAIMIQDKILILQNTYINSMLLFHYFDNVFALLKCIFS